MSPLFWQNGVEYDMVPYGQMPSNIVSAGSISPLAYNSAAVFAANQARAGRIIIPRTGTLTDLSILLAVQSGNIEVGVYDTGDALNGTRTKLYSTGSIACPAAGTWQTVGALSLPVTVGQQLELAVVADNITTSIARYLMQVAAQATLPANFWPTPGGAQPKLAAQIGGNMPMANVLEANWVTSSVVPAIIARIV